MHERISVNSLCFPGTPLHEQAAYWRDLAPRRVSFVSAQLIGDLSPAHEALKTGRYKVETVTHQFRSGRHVSQEDDSWRDDRARLMEVIEAAKTLGAQSIYMLTGGHGSLVWEDAAECFAAAVAPCVAKANEAGIALLVENAMPLYADVHIAHSLRDTIRLAEMAGIGICIDVFGCWLEADLRASIERAMPRCKLMQLSDYVYGDRSLPCRAIPGDGAIPLRAILQWALGAGYTGAFDLELIGPRITGLGCVEAVRKAAAHVGAILHSLGA